jgi:integrase
MGKTMENTVAVLCAPSAANVTVKRPREYLTEREVNKLIDAASENRWGHRDATAILIAYRHGLRASELVALRWDDIDFPSGKLHVRRAKGGQTSVHPLGARELRALRRLKRETEASTYVFVSERLAPQRGWLSAHGCEGGRGRTLSVPHSQPHAAPFVRLQARQRWPGHASDPALFGTQIHQFDGALHSVGA